MSRLLLISLMLCAAWSARADLPAAMKAIERGHYSTAVRALRKPAELGDLHARNNLGYLYEYGLGVQRNPEEAFKWYRLAAEGRLPAAQYNLATLYLQGRGAPNDPQAAFRWYDAAAKQGYADAEYMLGECYRTGAGTKRDAALALSWYLKAARNGQSAAQLMAASIYYTGEGWRRELPKAMVWAELARLNGEAQAVALTVQISRDLNEAQKALAIEKARLCRDSKYQDCPE